MFLDGEWFGRWNQSDTGAWHVGTAKIKEKDGRIYIMYWEGEDTSTGYLIEAQKGDDGKLVGAYRYNSFSETSPWVGRIVDGDRIDGVWNSTGARWDFRRRAVRKLPEDRRSK